MAAGFRSLLAWWFGGAGAGASVPVPTAFVDFVATTPRVFVGPVVTVVCAGGSPTAAWTATAPQVELVAEVPPVTFEGGIVAWQP